MLEVYVDYVICKGDKKETKATIHLSTERGEKGEISVAERGINKVDFMTKYLSKYANGMYSNKDNKFVALEDYGDSLEGYEPYHLNYCPEYIEREFRQSDESISGYTFGSWNPIYGGKVKATWDDINCHLEDNGTGFTQVALYDDFGSFLTVYSSIVAGTDCNQCALEAVKEVADLYYYSLEDGIWDINMGKDAPSGTCYYIDLDYDAEEILSLKFDRDIE